MDSDFWTTRLAAAKRQLNLQHHHHVSHTHVFSQFDRFGRDDFEVEEDHRSDFPCPYCFEEFDIASLCPHLEDEHPYESRPAVSFSLHLYLSSLFGKGLRGCVKSHDSTAWTPIQDILCVKRRSQLRRVPIPNNQALSLLGKDLREAHLQALLGGSLYRSNNAASSNAAAVADPFLSSLVLNFTGSESEEISKSVMSSIEEISSKSDALSPIWKSSSLDSSLSCEEREERTRQAAGRAVFLQDLLASALFSD
ncbi:protein DEHYDRATION-INDUCED 194-like [Dorcoceras hygrometricum]|uniref:Protein DEHYDRATION-INDUCED 194-like n=1 Tax=Dorcoceras hygrometricum TaxID=472368 RepID=A0A2Z7D7K8_9LAMI|nr:protein DEHYDRATION-INDUCED 194-like [Dorcoceras hygrometricum]